MTQIDLTRPMTVQQVAEGFAAGVYSAEQIANASLQHTRQWDATVGAFISVDDEIVLGQARAIDRQHPSHALLAGVPIAIKDSLCTVDYPTTCGSKMLMRQGVGWRSPFDATVVKRLRNAGAILFGKTNLDEFAMGSSTESSAVRITTNPWDRTRVPGGSSGGSAAAVAAGMVPGALGSDTGGSVRQPAALTGIVGLKPTYGRVSRYGLVAFASSLDQVGSLANDVRGACRVMDAIAGHDPLDATTLQQAWTPIEPCCGQPVGGMRVGLADEYFGEGLDPEVAKCVASAVDGLRGLGCTIEPIGLPHTRFAIATYYVIATAECSSNLARFDGIRFGHRDQAADVGKMIASTRGKGFGREVRRRILLGTFALSAGYHDAYYGKAQRVRAQIARDFARAFEQVDVILTPTTPTVAWPLGERLADPLTMYLADIYTVPASLAGLPAISVPCGRASPCAGGPCLPVGLQLIAPALCEDRLARVASAWEAINPHRGDVAELRRG